MIRVPLYVVGTLALAAVSLAAQAAEIHTALTLSDSVAEALQKNPELTRLRHRLEGMEARAKQASFLEDPEIVFQLNGVPFSNPTSFNQSDNNAIGIRQKLPFFGKLGLKEKIAQQESKVLEQELRAKEREVTAMTKMIYADLFMAQRAIEILREQLEIMRTITRATEARYEVGRVTQQDVFKALLERSDLMNQLIVVERETSAAEVKLNSVMYRPPRTSIRLPAELTLPESPAAFAAVEEMALASRPELKGAEEEIQRSERLYELAQRNRKFPDFMLGWDYMRMPTEMKKDRYAAMVAFSIPFSPWTVGKRNYEVEESLAEIRAAKAGREMMRVTALREAGEAQAKFISARRSLDLYKEAILSQSELTFRSALAAYQSGRVEFVTLLEAQRALREARMGYFKAQASVLQSLAELERAVGQELP